MRAAAPDYAAKTLDPPAQTAFSLDEVSNGFNLEHQYNQAILLIVIQLAFSDSSSILSWLGKPFLRHFACMVKPSKLRSFDPEK